MNPFIMMLFSMTMALGTTITLMSSHWLLAWMGLEINTLAIIPLMARHHHPRAVEATIKYFLTQATAAAMILFASLTNAWLSGQWDISQMSHPLPTTLITLALALKIGLAPLHAWLPEVLQGLDLTTGLILSTWQKLAPFALILQIQPTPSTLIIILGLTSVLIGGWGGLNQTQIRKILAYSSIAHMGWMTLILQFMPPLTLLALITYFITTLSLFLIFKHNSTTTLSMLSSSWSKAPALTALAPPVLLSIGGLPPLTGFGPKWLILQELAKQGLLIMGTLAALAALLSLYVYLRLSYVMALTLSPQTLPNIAPWRLKTLSLSLLLAAATTAAITLLPLTPLALALVTK
uniref:NADH dehydrogenase subunit 2 n=1 Tax=Starksia nanodes TaxID=57856 RepID=UPI0028D3268B|nr:NADH dehydrogenase subunit 2 [Starksia nanodes]WMY90553.1 NADH dehydrogenase subunit 2 [Starksia nanodes]